MTDNEGRVTSYGYDADGNRVRLAQANGRPIATTVDALGRATEIKNTEPISAGLWYDYQLAYDEYGNLKQQAETYPNGHLAARTVSLGYDLDDQLTSETTVTGTTTVQGNYTYDAGHNRTARVVTQTVGGGSPVTELSANYTYRADNALVGSNTTTPNNDGSSTDVQVAFTVDAVGNPVSVSGNNVAIPVSGDPVSTAAYAENFVFDYEQRLVQRAAGPPDSGNFAFSVDNYAYDYRSRRVLKDVGAGNYTSGSASVTLDTRTWPQFSGGVSAREYVTSNTSGNAAVWTGANTTAASVEYIRGSDWGGGVGGVVYSLHSDVPSFYHYDGRGDVVAQTMGASGSLVYQAAYDSEGRHNPTGAAIGSALLPPALGTQEWSAGGINTDDLRTNTKEEDPLDLVDDGMRIRDLDAGRFLTPDPLGVFGPDGPNLYAYCTDNPWSKYDALGLSGNLTIVAVADGSTTYGVTTGRHAYISYQPDDKRPAFTVGTWGFNGKNASGTTVKAGVDINVEKNDPAYTGTQTRTEHLTDAQEAQLKTYVEQQQKAGASAWTRQDPCSSFAAGAWDTATGEKIDPRNGTPGLSIPMVVSGASTPQMLGAAIKKANGGKDTAVVESSAKADAKANAAPPANTAPVPAEKQPAATGQTAQPNPANTTAGNTGG